MSKIIKRTLALLLVSAMVLCAFTGCSKKSSGKDDDDSSGKMFSSLGSIMESGKYTAELDADIVNDGTSQKFSMSIQVDGNKASVGLSLNAGGMDMSIPELMVCDEKAAYINIGGIFDKVASFLAMMGIDKAQLGITKDWVKFANTETADVTSSTATLGSSLEGIFDGAFDDVVEEKGRTKTISITSGEDVKKLAKSLAKVLTDNKDKIVKEAYAIVSGLNADEIKDKLSGSMSDDQLAKVDQVLDNMSEAKISEAIDEMTEGLNSYDGSDFEGSYMFSVTDGSDEFELSAKVEPSDDESVNVKLSVEEGCEDISIPSDDEVMDEKSLEEAMQKLSSMGMGMSGAFGGLTGGSNATAAFGSMLNGVEY